MGTLSLKETVHELCRQHPGLVKVLEELGFEGITNPIMMRTAAKVMTIPKAAAMRGVEMKLIVEKLKEAGYHLKGGDQGNE